MAVLRCPTCRFRVFFEDQECLRCESPLAYSVGGDCFLRPLSGERCASDGHQSCNWIPLADSQWCAACTRICTAEGVVSRSSAAVFRSAVRQVIADATRAGIELDALTPPLRFLLDEATPEHPVVIGHDNGLITIEVAEADPAYREETRVQLGEKYRTPVGHIRHELGHWHWQASIEPDSQLMSDFRFLFGDESLDYAQALQDHYSREDDGSYANEYLSFYAAAHPWEDYAETFAHILHMHATLEVARNQGLNVVIGSDFDAVYPQWQALTVTLNELSRAMGVPDPYPFAPSEPAVAKLSFVHATLGLAG